MTEDVPRFYAGQTVNAAIAFRNFARTPMRRVVVAFAHERESDFIFELTGEPEHVGDDRCFVELSGYVSPEDLIGLYRGESAVIEYEDDQTISFKGTPNVSFRIEREAILSPELYPGTEWRWGSP